MHEVLPKTKRMFGMRLKFRAAASSLRMIRATHMGKAGGSVGPDFDKLTSLVYEIDRQLGEDCPDVCLMLMSLFNDVREESRCYDDTCLRCDEIVSSFEERLAEVEREWDAACGRQQAVQRYHDVVAACRGAFVTVLKYFVLAVLFLGSLFVIGLLVF